MAEAFRYRRHVTLLGERDECAHAPLEQRGPEFTFEFPDRTGNGGLSTKQRRARAACAALLGDSQERSQMAKLQLHPPTGR